MDIEAPHSLDMHPNLAALLLATAAAFGRPVGMLELHDRMRANNPGIPPMLLGKLHMEKVFHDAPGWVCRDGVASQVATP